MVSAFATSNGLCLGQVKVDSKSHEITAILELLELLTLKGRIVTLDAMGCQKNIGGAIKKKEADYELKDLEKRVDAKISRTVKSDLVDPFPFDRFQKDREIESISRAIRMFIEQDQEKDAAVLLQILQDKGVKLNTAR